MFPTPKITHCFICIFYYNYLYREEAMEMKLVKKTYLLPQKLIDKTKRALKARTETEAIIRALEDIVFNQTLLQWDQRNTGRLKIKNGYG